MLTDSPRSLFAGLFLGTGLFAIAGALYTWGSGWLFIQADLLSSLIPWADLLVTGPVSLITARGLYLQKSWGIPLGLITVGVYLLGSVLVYVKLIWTGPPYLLQLALPPVCGIALSVTFTVWAIRDTFSGSGKV